MEGKWLFTKEFRQRLTNAIDWLELILKAFFSVIIAEALRKAAKRLQRSRKVNEFYIKTRVFLTQLSKSDHVKIIGTALTPLCLSSVILYYIVNLLISLTFTTIASFDLIFILAIALSLSIIIAYLVYKVLDVSEVYDRPSWILERFRNLFYPRRDPLWITILSIILPINVAFILECKYRHGKMQMYERIADFYRRRPGEEIRRALLKEKLRFAYRWNFKSMPNFSQA